MSDDYLQFENMLNKQQIASETDLLIRCKHFQSANIRYPVLRIMLNTGFIFDNIIRFYKKDVDLSPHCKLPENFFIDVIVEFIPNENEQKKSTLLEDYIYLVDSCKKNGLLANKIDNKMDKQEQQKEKQKELIDQNIKSILETAITQSNRNNTDDFSIITETDTSSDTIKQLSLQKESSTDQEETIVKVQNKEDKQEEELYEKIIQQKNNLNKQIASDDDEDEEEEDIDDYLSKLEQNS